MATDVANETEDVRRLNREVGVDSEITLDELLLGLRSLKVGKAAGCDNIRPEMIQYLGERGRNKLLRVCNMVWKHNTVPSDWENALILPIYKKGSTSSCDNYRGISMLCAATELYEKILERRLRVEIEDKIQREQSGFRPGHSTQDHLFTIRQVIEKALCKSKEIYMCFIDTEKAFDTLNRDLIWKALKDKEVSEGLIGAISSLYKRTTNQIRTEKFVTTRGVRQGSCLSPLLFIVAFDEIARQCKEKFIKYYVGYHNLSPISLEMCIFADDVLLLADTEDKMQQNLLIYNETAKKYELHLNKTKTQIMKVNAKEEAVSEGGISIINR